MRGKSKGIETNDGQAKLSKHWRGVDYVGRVGGQEAETSQF